MARRSKKREDEEIVREAQERFDRAHGDDDWEALVARKGWSEDEAEAHWHEWVTGPPGLFG